MISIGRIAEVFCLNSRPLFLQIQELVCRRVDEREKVGGPMVSWRRSKISGLAGTMIAMVAATPLCINISSISMCPGVRNITSAPSLSATRFSQDHIVLAEFFKSLKHPASTSQSFLIQPKHQDVYIHCHPCCCEFPPRYRTIGKLENPYTFCLLRRLLIIVSFDRFRLPLPLAP